MVVRELIGWNPLGLKIISTLRGYRSNVVSDHDLVVEAFPRSANTYISAIAILAFPDKKIARHTHSLGQIKIALKNRTPTLIVVRSPKEAILSNMIRFPLVSPWVLLYRYFYFHKYVLKHKDSLSILRFQDAVGAEIEDVVRIIEMRIGEKSDYIPNKEEVISKVEEMESEDNSGAGVRETHVARPSATRDLMKVDLEAKLHGMKNKLAELEALYMEIVKD